MVEKQNKKKKARRSNVVVLRLTDHTYRASSQRIAFSNRNMLTIPGYCRRAILY